MELSGARLKKIRLEKGLSLEEVHKKTKIHLKVLKALEEDNLLNVDPVYVRGFLKIYCKFLNLDPATLVPEQKETTRPARSRATESPKVSVRIKVPAARLFKKENLLRYWNKNNLIIAGSLIALLLVFFIAGRLLGLKRHKVFPAPEKYNSLSPVKPQVNNLRFPNSRAAEVPARRSPLSAGVRLVMRANKDCYIVLKTDGRTVFRATLKKGKSETWSAKERIEFSLSNASAVNLELNGEPLPALAQKKRMLKSVLITKDGRIAIQ